MSAAFVVDCSIAMAWLFHDVATPKTAAWLNRLATEDRLHKLESRKPPRLLVERQRASAGCSRPQLCDKHISK